MTDPKEYYKTLGLKCWCYKCALPFTLENMFKNNFMRLCPECGNKRCPKASDHELACTGSNDSGQPGSIYK